MSQTDPTQFVKEAMAAVKGNSPKQPVFVFGMHKGGSTMLHDFFDIYTRRLKIKSISISDHLFSRGVSDETYTRDINLCSVLNQNYVFFGFRYVPEFMILNKVKYLNRKAVILIRDPRDCVVSAYYSFLKTHHVIPPSTTDAALSIQREREKHSSSSIDQYASEEIWRFVEELSGYAYFSHENSKLFRYEDVIFKKRQFFLDSLSHLELQWNEAAFEASLKAVDVFPAREQVDAHIRNVKPGNYLEKLSKATIRELNSRFRHVLELYGYF